MKRKVRLLNRIRGSKPGRQVCTLALLLLAGISASAAYGEVADFALIDQDHRFHQLSHYRDHKALVLYVEGGDCDTKQAAMSLLRELRDAHGEVAFLMINADLAESPASIRERAKDCGIDFPVLVDEAQLVAQQLELRRQGEVLLIDPAKREIVFRGPVAEGRQQYLADALAAFIQGNKPSQQTVAHTSGKALSFSPIFTRQVSYQDEVVPILEQRCVESVTLKMASHPGP